MADQINKQVAEFFQRMREMPSISPEGIKQLDEAIKLLERPNYIKIPNPEDNHSETIIKIWKIADDFLESEPKTRDNMNKIKFHNENFERLENEIETPTPGPKQNRGG